MTSARKIEANRANARSSTGPRTRRGRARAARNAFRHGLSLPIQVDQALYQAARALADQIAGLHASAHVKMLALRVAEAQIDLLRVRAARHQFLSQRLSDPNYDPRKLEKTRVVSSLWRLVAFALSTAPAAETVTTLQGPQKLAAILSNEDKNLRAMDRYERRALSRRRFAIRTFDSARIMGL